MEKRFNFTKKDEINSVSATPLQKMGDDTFILTGAAIVERADESGELKEVGLLATSAGTYSTISTTAIKGLGEIIDYMEDIQKELAPGDDAALEIKVVKNKSNAGREFLTLQII